jgi:hypothetical protein
MGLRMVSVFVSKPSHEHDISDKEVHILAHKTQLLSDLVYQSQVTPVTPVTPVTDE